MKQSEVLDTKEVKYGTITLESRMYGYSKQFVIVHEYLVEKNFREDEEAAWKYWNQI